MFRFRLRTMLIAVAVLAVPMAWLRWDGRERRAALAEVVSRGGAFAYKRPESLHGVAVHVRAIAGDPPVDFVGLPKGLESERQSLQAVFPEATIFIYDLIDDMQAK